MTRIDNHHTFVVQALREAAQFCQRVKESASGDELLEEADAQSNVLTNLIDIFHFIVTNEGRDPRIDGSYTTEIHRNSVLPDRAFSCTPIFIIGSGRSGTTLLAQFINASDSIFAVPETWLAGTIASCDPIIAIGHTLKRKLREPFRRYLWRLARMCDELYSDVARSNDKERWVSKELFIPHRLDLLDAMFDYRAQYIYAVRHGFDVAESCCARLPARDGFPLNNTTSLNIESYLRDWISNNESTKSFYDRNRDRCLMVRYEDLVERPAYYGRALFEFLGEQWTDDILDHLGEHALAAGMGDNRIYGLDGKIVRSESLWRSWPRALQSTLGRLANPTLERLGYEAVPTDLLYP
jgi:protein-tyrosine sulfotransferase